MYSRFSWAPCADGLDSDDGLTSAECVTQNVTFMEDDRCDSQAGKAATSSRRRWLPRWRCCLWSWMSSPGWIPTQKVDLEEFQRNFDKLIWDDDEFKSAAETMTKLLIWWIWNWCLERSKGSFAMRRRETKPNWRRWLCLKISWVRFRIKLNYISRSKLYTFWRVKWNWISDISL